MKQSEPVFIRNTGSINVLDDLLKSLDCSKQFRIGFEATGHYGMNLKLFHEKNDYSFTTSFNSWM